MKNHSCEARIINQTSPTVFLVSSYGTYYRADGRGFSNAESVS